MIEYKYYQRTFDVSYNYIPITRGTKTLRNFDPGEPDSGGVIEDIEVSYYSEFYKKTFELDYHKLPEKMRFLIEKEILSHA